MDLEGPGGAGERVRRSAGDVDAGRAAGGKGGGWRGHRGGSWALVGEFYRSLEPQGGAGMGRLQAMPGPTWLEPNRKY